VVIRDYERFQLALIAQDYESRGYTVTLEERLANTGVTFDAVARREVDGSMVVIEIVNAMRSDALEQRRKAFAKLAEAFPGANVDLRYVDPALPKWAPRLATQPGTREALLDAGEPEGYQMARNLLFLWSYHAALLRAYNTITVELLDKEQLYDDPKDILTLYNQLLASGRLRDPAAVADDVDLDLFELFDVVTAAVQGCPITAEEVEQMRRHLFSIGEQISASGGV
jgi:hypothetical protein